MANVPEKVLVIVLSITGLLDVAFLVHIHKCNTNLLKLMAQCVTKFLKRASNSGTVVITGKQVNRGASRRHSTLIATLPSYHALYCSNSNAPFIYVSMRSNRENRTYFVRNILDIFHCPFSDTAASVPAYERCQLTGG